MKTKIILSVDVEFSIAGTFIDPINKTPVGLQAVLCERNGHSHGLGFILDILNKYNINATFFVEALNTNYFGHDLMGTVAHTIAARGQDIQLHLHPCWQYFRHKNWQELLKINPPNDDICQRPLTEIESILQEGLDIFSQWSLSRPIAIRTGSLFVKKDVYKAMQKIGIKYSSNIGVGIFKPFETDLQFYSGCHEIENCFEVPVLTYCDINLFSKKHLKLLTITGSNWQEIEFLLHSAAQKQLEYVVILTHPSEFIKKQNDQYTDFNSNKINKNRFEKLCQFLRNNEEHFTVTTFSELPISNNNTKSNTLLEVPPLLVLNRMIENYANDRIASL